VEGAEGTSVFEDEGPGAESGGVSEDGLTNSQSSPLRC
jgi:hypothetical protein